MSWDRIQRLEVELVSRDARIAQLEAQLAVSELVDTDVDRALGVVHTSMHDQLRHAVRRIHELSEELLTVEEELYEAQLAVELARGTAVALEGECAACPSVEHHAGHAYREVQL